MAGHPASSPILEVAGLHKRFPLDQKLIGAPKHFIYAVNGVSLRLHPGCTVGLVGESGCGKSTIGKLICGLETPDSGQIRFRGKDISRHSSAEKMAYHRRVQIIFQNPYTSLNPRRRAGRMLEEIFRVHRLCDPAEIEKKISEILEAVGLPPESRQRYPFEFSGGQRQRLCIARALAVQPEAIVCDEPVSALDVSIQAQILRLLKKLQKEYNLAYLFISHDLSVVYHVCDEVLIMYLGRIVERGPVEQIFKNPAHPYTKALLSAVPLPDPASGRKRIILSGEIPSPTRIPPGCPFYSRCSQRMEVCENSPPPARQVGPGQETHCWLYE